MAAVDAAVLSVTRPEIEVLVEQSKWGSRRLRRVKQEITRSVVVIVIVTNTINVLGPILVSRQGLAVFGNQGIAIVTVVLTIGTIIFSEIIPKARRATLRAPGRSNVFARDFGRARVAFSLGGDFFATVWPSHQASQVRGYGRANPIARTDWTKPRPYRARRRIDDPSRLCFERQDGRRNHDACRGCQSVV